MDGTQPSGGVERDFGAGLIQQPEEREALDVVPMIMGQEYVQAERSAIEFREQRLTQVSNSHPSVENNYLILRPSNFQTRSIPTVPKVALNGCGRRAARAPDFQPKVVQLIQVVQLIHVLFARSRPNLKKCGQGSNYCIVSGARGGTWSGP